jgi:hypothetical protein
MRYLLLVLALATVIVGAYKSSSRETVRNPVRTADMVPWPPHAR